MTSISIITAVYNAAETISDTLESVRTQSIPVEHIIIDGASTDKTLEIIQDKGCGVQRSGFEVRGSRFEVQGTGVSVAPSPALNFEPRTICVSEPDKGIYDALNKGITLARGDIIGILHANDVYATPDVLARVAQVFEDPSVEACYGDLEYVRDSSRFKVQSSGVEDSSLNIEQLTQNSFTVVRYWKSGHYSPRSFYRGWMPPHPTFFCRRSVYERFGGFDLSLGTAADYELMLRFMLKHAIRTEYIPEVLVRMRVGGASNESFGARLRANRMDRRAWEVNGLKPYPWTILMKPLRKLGQYVRRQAR